MNRTAGAVQACVHVGATVAGGGSLVTANVMCGRELPLRCVQRSHRAHLRGAGPGRLRGVQAAPADGRRTLLPELSAPRGQPRWRCETVTRSAFIVIRTTARPLWQLCKVIEP